MYKKAEGAVPPLLIESVKDRKHDPIHAWVIDENYHGPGPPPDLHKNALNGIGRPQLPPQMLGEVKEGQQLGQVLPQPFHHARVSIAPSPGEASGCRPRFRSVLGLVNGLRAGLDCRLAPEWPMPACIEDVKCAVRWFRAHARDYNLDPKRVGAFGYSAGAHLVAMPALSASDRTLEGDDPYKDQPSNVQAACVGGTPVDFLNWGAERRSDAPAATEISGGSPEAVEQRATRFFPLSHVSADAPPMLVIHGNADKSVPLSQAERLVKALRGAGAKKVVFIVFDGAGHGLFNGYSPIVLGTMAGFFDSSLGK